MHFVTVDKSNYILLEKVYEIVYAVVVIGLFMHFSCLRPFCCFNSDRIKIHSTPNWLYAQLTSTRLQKAPGN